MKITRKFIQCVDGCTSRNGKQVSWTQISKEIGDDGEVCRYRWRVFRRWSSAPQYDGVSWESTYEAYLNKLERKCDECNNQENLTKFKGKFLCRECLCPEYEPKSIRGIFGDSSLSKFIER